MNVCSVASTSNQIPFGSFTPDQAASVYFVFYADDCLLHFTAEQLTPRQQADHEANVALTAMLQVALTYMGRSKDHLALHDAFKQPPWAQLLAFYQRTFADLFGDVIPPENCHYFPNHKFYETVAATKMPTELLGLYMVSGSNVALHGSTSAWELSQRVNSKLHFAATAPAAGIPTPATLVCEKRDLGNTATQAFFARHGNQVMVKILGLAGARNVTSVTSIDEATTYLAEFSDDTDVVLQERLNANDYTEMTVDLKVTDDEVSITNVRKILFAEGLWVGNYISSSLQLSQRQENVCRQVGEYVRNLGYSSPQGLNCGIDFFVKGDDIIVIEINARWTGGLFPAHLIERLHAQREHSVAFIDVISTAALPAYQQFIGEHLHAHEGSGFRIVPMGFSPFVQTMDGVDRVYVWQVVLGDYEAFKSVKNQTLGDTELPTADAITLNL